MKSALSPSRRPRPAKRRVIRLAGASIAAAVTTALVAATPVHAVAATDTRAGAPDLVDRVAALRQVLVRKGSLVIGSAPWSDQTLTPGTTLTQWKNWKNG